MAYAAAYSYVLVTQNECNITGHTYTYETTQAPTCAATGVRTYTCSSCGNQYAEDIPAVEHVYEYGVDREATCTTGGIILYTCTGCGTQYTESIPATGSHSYSYSIQTPATCTTPGVGLYECIYCGTSYTEEIASGGGHKYETCVIREVSCTKDGLVAYVCSECADEYTAVATAPGHFYEVTETVATEYDDSGAVVTIGYIVYECTTCGVSYTENDVVFGEGDSWLDWLGDLFKNIGSSIVNGLSNALEYVLETVIVTVTDWLTQLVEWAFDLFDGELVSQWFNWFSDDNPYFISDFGSDVDVWAYVPVFSGDDSNSSGGIVCSICGIADCTTTHVWCAVCDKYDCGLDHEDNDDDSNSASDILDNELPIEWNSLEVANNSVKVDVESLPLVKVSDLMLTYAELSAASLSVSTPDGSCEVMPVYLENEAGHAAAVFAVDTADVEVVIISILDTSAASSSFDVEFPETGLYALDLASLGVDTSFDFVLRMSDDTLYLTTPITDESVIFTYTAFDTVFVMEKVSDDLLTRDELLNATLIYGEEIVPVSDWVSLLGDEIVVEDESGVHLDVFYIWVFSVSDPDVLADEVVIPEPGLYLLSAELVDGVYESLGVALQVFR